MERIYLVTGGLGHLGSTVIESLLERGERVRALILKSDRGRFFKGVEYIIGDVRDVNSMRPFFSHKEGEEVYLIHTAGIISIAEKGTRDLREVNVEGTKNVIALSKEYGVKRMIYISSVHALTEREDVSLLRETSHYDSSSVYGEYAKSKADASNLVLDAVKEGLDAVIVLPSGIIGPGDNGRNHLVQMALMYLTGKLPMGVEGGYDMVDVRDVADGILKAIEKGRTGESYILSGTSVTIKELIKYMAKASGKRVLFCAPLKLARLFSPFITLDAKRRHKRPLYTKYSLMTLKSNTRYSHDKASCELGYKPRDISESVRDMVLYLRVFLSRSSDLTFSR